MRCPSCKNQQLIDKPGFGPVCESCGWSEGREDRERSRFAEQLGLLSVLPMAGLVGGRRAGSAFARASRRAAEYRARRKTPPMTQEERDAQQVDLDPTGEVGLAAIDFDLETIRLLTDDLRAKHGRLPEKKLRKLQAEIWERRRHERRNVLNHA